MGNVREVMAQVGGDSSKRCNPAHHVIEKNVKIQHTHIQNLSSMMAK